MLQRKTLVLALMLASTLAACGRDEAPPADDADTATTEATEEAAAQAEAVQAEAADTAAPAPGDTAAQPLVASDLDAYVKAVNREIEMLKPHVDAVKAAREKKDTTTETAALFAMSQPYDEEAAKAAGLEVERYKHVRNAIDEVLSKRQAVKLLEQQVATMEATDTSGATPEQKAEHDKAVAEFRALIEDPYATLPPDVATAMKAREDELDKLRNESLGLRFSVL